MQKKRKCMHNPYSGEKNSNQQEEMSSGPEVEFNKDLLRSYKYTQSIKGKWAQKTEGKCAKHE